MNQLTNVQMNIILSAGNEFLKYDPYGIGMTVIAMSIVFIVFFLLFVIFGTIARAYNIDIKRRGLIKKGKIAESEKLQDITTGDINAAIAMALHLYKSRLNDMEDTHLTIQRVSKTYSPWSSKIYGLRKSPR